MWVLIGLSMVGNYISRAKCGFFEFGGNLYTTGVAPQVYNWYVRKSVPCVNTNICFRPEVKFLFGFRFRMEAFIDNEVCLRRNYDSHQLQKAVSRLLAGATFRHPTRDASFTNLLYARQIHYHVPFQLI